MNKDTKHISDSDNDSEISESEYETDTNLSSDSSSDSGDDSDSSSSDSSSDSDDDSDNEQSKVVKVADRPMKGGKNGDVSKEVPEEVSKEVLEEVPEGVSKDVPEEEKNKVDAKLDAEEAPNIEVNEPESTDNYESGPLILGSRENKLWATKYERARIIGTRATQLAKGMPDRLKEDEREKTKGVIEKAKLEYFQRETPFIIERRMPSGKKEYVTVQELQ